MDTHARSDLTLTIMAAAKYDIQVEEGAGLSLALVYKDETGTPIDISGATITMSITDNSNDDTSDDFAGAFVTDGTDGAFTVIIASTAIDALAFTNGRYLISLSGSVIADLIYGKFQVKQLPY